MPTLQEAIAWFRAHPDARPDPKVNPFPLGSTVDGPADPTEVRSAWRRRAIPSEAEDLWSICRSARLFVDLESDQWGLALLDPAASVASTATARRLLSPNLRRDDVVIGEFIGDGDLLIISPSEGGDRRVLVAPEMESREEWFAVGHDLAVFLASYAAALGEKFWEAQRIAELNRQQSN